MQVTDYLTLEFLKNSLNINSEKHDTRLLDIIFTSNSDVDSRLKPFAGTTPIEVDSDSFYQAKQAASRYARSIWYENMGQLERAKHSLEMYEIKMKSLIAAVKAERTDTTEVVFVAGPDHLKRIYEPAATDQYLD